VIVGRIVGRGGGHRFVQLGVEGDAHLIHAPYAHGVELLAELAFNESDALVNRPWIRLGRVHVREARQVLEGVYEPAQQVRLRLSSTARCAP